MPWNDGLEGMALNIAACDAECLMVVAGPGTGKTFALIRRVARLLEEGAMPSRVLVCTFTRTAAADLEKELSKLGSWGAEQVRAGTIHSHCFRILARNSVLEITGRVPRPLLKFEERFLLEDLRYLTGKTVSDCKEQLKAFNAAWARLQSEDPGWPNDPADRAFHDQLVWWLHFHRAMLIGELVPETVRYLRDNPLCDERQEFDHVAVDEYQDLNRAEQVLLDLLSDNATFTIVGDQDQAIYESLKYAHPEGIAEFPSCHPDTESRTLDECRRCPHLVVQLGNSLIANNASREPRSLLARESNPEGEVHVVQWLTPEKEAQGIAEFISRRITAGHVLAGSVLVLSPRRHLGYGVRDTLNEMSIPAHSFFHEQALEGKPKEPDEALAQEAFTLLALLARPDDRVALRCWCGFGSPSLRAGEWGRLRAYCQQHREDPKDVLTRLAAREIQIPNTTRIVERHTALHEGLSDLQDLEGQDLFDALFPDGEEWASGVREIGLAVMDEIDEVAAPEGITAGVLREQLRLGIYQPELPTDVDYVRVMSLHMSKGLTADLVVIVGCNEGLIPTLPEHASPAVQAGALQEARRLFYVALTRTRNILVLSCAQYMPGRAAHRMRARSRPISRDYARTTPSPFLTELGPHRPTPLSGDEMLQQLENRG